MERMQGDQSFPNNTHKHLYIEEEEKTERFEPKKWQLHTHTYNNNNNSEGESLEVHRHSTWCFCLTLNLQTHSFCFIYSENSLECPLNSEHNSTGKKKITQASILWIFSVSKSQFASSSMPLLCIQQQLMLGNFSWNGSRNLTEAWVFSVKIRQF